VLASEEPGPIARFFLALKLDFGMVAPHKPVPAGGKHREPRGVCRTGSAIALDCRLE